MAYLERFRHKKTIEPPPADAPKPPTVPQKLHLQRSFPILHRDCGIFGDVLELEDHLKLGVWVLDDGRVEGGETWPKRLWLRDFGRYPWIEE